MIRVVGMDRSADDAVVDSQAPLAPAEEYGTPLEQPQEPLADRSASEPGSNARTDKASQGEASPAATLAGEVATGVDGEALERATSELIAALGGKVTSEYYLIVTAREALRTGSCDESRRALAELDSAMKDASPNERAQVKSLWSLFSGKCPGRSHE